MNNIETNSTIKKILSEDPKTRGNDCMLILEVWKSQGLVMAEEQYQYILSMCSDPETITRCRRKHQELGRYMKNDEMERQREININNWRNKFYGTKTLL